MSQQPKRRQAIAVDIAGIGVGGDNPVRVQSMTDTDTSDVKRTVNQIAELAAAGSEFVRITVNNEAAARAVPEIKTALLRQQITTPLVGDFHYNGHRLLKQFPDCAEMLDKYRINPGNVGFGHKRDQQFSEMIEVALRYDKPVRIGVNWGSLDQAVLASMLDDNAKLAQPASLQAVTHDALIHSALASAAYAESLGMQKNKLIISVKVSEVQDLVTIYQRLATECDYALHLGLTEAGMSSKGIVASTAALAILLQQGIGDTIRCSLTPLPGASRTEEVIICQHILQSLGLRSFTPLVSACPGCGRTTSSYFRELANKVQTYVHDRIPVWREHYVAAETMKVAVMGCVVNGPGESKQANLGISLPGTGEAPIAPVFANGEKITTLRGETILEDFYQIIEDYVAANYAKRDHK